MPRSKSGTGVRSHRCSCDQSHIRSDGTSYLSPFPQLSHSFLVKYIVLPTPLCGVPCPCYVAAAAKIRTLLSQETRATGKTLSEPACKKKWGEVECISLPSIRHPPKPNPPHRCLSATKNSSTTPQHSPEEALQTVAYASTTAWVSGRKETGLGLEGAIKLLRAPHINVPISVLSTTAPRTRQSSSRLALQLSHSQVPSFSTRNQVRSLEETQLPVQVCYPLGQEEEDQVNVCGSSPSSSTEVSRSSASLRLIEAW